MDLENCLKEYKALTLDIMERVSIDVSIEYLVNERQLILDTIINSDFLLEDIKKISNYLNIKQLENDLKLLIKKEKAATKRNIENLKKMKNANMKYMSIGYVPSRFNKKM